jgi:formylmethanofuran dehydrogenase subunit E
MPIFQEFKRSVELYEIERSPIMDTVCADCGISTPWELQYGVPDDEGGTKIVCEECAKKYGFNING